MDRALMDALAPLRDSQTWQEAVRRAVPALGAKSELEAEAVLRFALGGPDVREGGAEPAVPEPLRWLEALLRADDAAA